ncbi:MAG: hypothetical protein QMC79_08965 [Anaerosomatales bacterium]|nr:hypothetical protein [Anaerosomatales bacterium]
MAEKNPVLEAPRLAHPVPCPACGLVTREVRCPRCNALTITSCAGACLTCKASCSSAGSEGERSV